MASIRKQLEGIDKKINLLKQKKQAILKTCQHESWSKIVHKASPYSEEYDWEGYKCDDCGYITAGS